MWEQIRKFGPDYSDLPTIIWNVNFLLRALTLNVDRRLKTPIPIAFYLLAIFCSICFCYGYLFSVLWFVFWRNRQTKDLTAVMVAVSLGVASQISAIKLIYDLIFASRLRCLVDQCLESDALSEPESRFSKSMKKAMRNVKMRATSFWCCINVIAVAYIIMPMFLPGRHLPEDLLIFYGLEPSLETPNYEITYFIMTSAVLFICYATATLPVLSIVIIGYTEAQMTALSQEVLSVWEDSIQDTVQFKIELLYALFENRSGLYDDNKDDETKMLINLSVRSRLIEIVRNHSRNVTLLQNVDEFFSVPNGIAFGFFGVGLIAELLGGLENTYLQIPFTFIQVALDCFTGQRIMDASQTFERAVYSCKWENFDKDNMKIVLLMLQNSQKTMAVSAGGITILNFACLMGIVRSVYSTYTTLRSMI